MSGIYLMRQMNGRQQTCFNTKSRKYTTQGKTTSSRPQMIFTWEDAWENSWRVANGQYAPISEH